MANGLFVRTRHFGGDVSPYYWSETGHAWGSLASATVYRQSEVKSMTRHPENDQPDHATYFRESTQSRMYVPGDGDWEALPDGLRIMTMEELYEDLR